MSIVVFGSLNADTTLDVERQPAWGETILARGSSTAAGGKGANQATAARRLGAEVVMVGRVGRDAAGEFLRASLAADGVQAALTADEAAPTGSAFILRGGDGRNAIVVAQGANGTASARDLERARTGGGTTVLVLQLEVPVAEARAAAAHGRRLGWHVILNPAPAAPIDRAFLASVDTLVANEHEAAQLTGIPVNDVPSARAAADALREAGCGTVAVTLGDRGAVLVGPGGAWHAPAPRVTAVDTTAAGDAFVGALAVACLEGMTLPDALRLAVAAGSLTVTTRGAQPSLPARSAALELAATISVMELAASGSAGRGPASPVTAAAGDDSVGHGGVDSRT